ncbi:MAG TPA: MXAN_6640 family putative metalloprotease [Marmoricola sp.]|nr:MXAN_6640 family putative metalloprotease [Marmoricola sp.]
MRISWKSSTILGVAVALVLAIPATTQASASRHGTDTRAHREAKAALVAVQDALSHGQRPNAPRTDLSLLLRDLRFALPALTPSERAEASALLGLYIPPPRSNCAATLTEKVVATAHFCVHYTSSSTPEWARTTADTLEYVWHAEVDQLHFRAPLRDGDGLFDVYLREIGDQGYYGACAPYDNARHSRSSCVLDDDFSPSEFGGAAPLNSLRVTAAHEFFHAIQYAYDTTEDIWFMEGTAVWAEDQVFPTINDYRQYLPFSAIPHPRTPIDYEGITSSDLYYRYGAVLFWKFLSEQFRDPTIIRRVWEYADGDRYSLQAVAATLAERGWSFGKAFARFGVWNTLPRGTYGDRAIFPSPAWWQVAKLGRHHRDTGTHTVVLNHLTNAASYFNPARKLPRRTKLRITVTGPSLGHLPRATVQVRHPDGTYRLVEVPLDSAGDGTVVVRFNPRKVAAVVVTVTNASPRMTCGVDPDDRYSCAGESPDDGRTFGVRARVKLP